MKRLSSPERGRNAEGNGDRPKAILDDVTRLYSKDLVSVVLYGRVPSERKRHKRPISKAPAPPGRYRDAATGGSCRSVPTAPYVQPGLNLFGGVMLWGPRGPLGISTTARGDDPTVTRPVNGRRGTATRSAGRVA